MFVPGDKNSQHVIIGDDERPKVLNAVDSGDVPIEIMKNKIRLARTEQQRKT